VQLIFITFEACASHTICLIHGYFQEHIVMCSVNVVNLYHYVNYSRLPVLATGCLLHRANLLIL